MGESAIISHQLGGWKGKGSFTCRQKPEQDSIACQYDMSTVAQVVFIRSYLLQRGQNKPPHVCYGTDLHALPVPRAVYVVSYRSR